MDLGPYADRTACKPWSVSPKQVFSLERQCRNTNDQIKRRKNITKVIYVVSWPINLPVAEILLKNQIFPVKHLGLAVIKDSAPSGFTVGESHSSGSDRMETSPTDQMCFTCRPAVQMWPMNVTRTPTWTACATTWQRNCSYSAMSHLYSKVRHTHTATHIHAQTHTHTCGSIFTVPTYITMKKMLSNNYYLRCRLSAAFFWVNHESETHCCSNMNWKHVELSLTSASVMVAKGVKFRWIPHAAFWFLCGVNVWQQKASSGSSQRNCAGVFFTFTRHFPLMFCKAYFSHKVILFHLSADCTKKQVDLVFLFDGSGSMTEAEFKENKNFIKKIMDSLEGTSFKVCFTIDARVLEYTT